jgi:protein transport protein SEC31
MRLRKADKTATLAWHPRLPLLAGGTVSGALDSSFSTTTELDIFDLDLSNSSQTLKRLGSIAAPAR